MRFSSQARCDVGHLGRGGAEALCDCRHHEGDITHRREGNEHRAAVRLLREQTSELDREPRLAGTARTDDREDARVTLQRHRHGVVELRLASQEGGCRRRQVDCARGAHGRKRSRADLQEPRGRIEVLQAMAPEVGEWLDVDERARGLGNDGLATMGERGNAGGPVHVDAHVALVGDGGRPGVNADAYAYGAAGQRLVHGLRGGGCPARSREGDEERVPLRVDLDAAVRRERLPQRMAMIGESVCVRLRSETVQKPRRALHVGEQEGDGAGRQV